jgi:hypothetical protein
MAQQIFLQFLKIKAIKLLLFLAITLWPLFEYSIIKLLL